MTDEFLKLTQQRRSVYSLGNEMPIYPEELTRLFRECIKNCPTPFNSQSGRMVVLYRINNRRLWNLTEDILKELTPAESFTKTKQKLDGFSSGIGTILFFIDDSVTEALQKKYPLYAKQFPIWAEQSIGMLQYMVWTALAEHKIGASLQHYNPLIDEQVHHSFDIPSTWKLSAQMPFGSIVEAPQEKTYEPLDKRLRFME